MSVESRNRSINVCLLSILFISAQCPELLPIQNGRITYAGDSDNMAEYDIGTVAT